MKKQLIAFAFIITLASLMLIGTAQAQTHPDYVNVNFTTVGNGTATVTDSYYPYTVRPCTDLYTYPWGYAMTLHSYANTGANFINWTISNATRTTILSTYPQPGSISLSGQYSQSGAFNVTCYFSGATPNPTPSHPTYINIWMNKDGYGTMSPAPDYYTYTWGTDIALNSVPLGGGTFLNYTISNSTNTSLLSTNKDYWLHTHDTNIAKYAQSGLFNVTGYFSLPDPSPPPSPPTWVSIWTNVEGTGNATLTQSPYVIPFPEYSTFAFGSPIILTATTPGLSYWEIWNSTYSQVWGTESNATMTLNSQMAWSGAFNITAHFNPPAPTTIYDPVWNGITGFLALLFNVGIILTMAVVIIVAWLFIRKHNAGAGM